MPDNFVVCLDPGHGGNDPGAIGFGLKESILTLDIAALTRDQIVNTYPDVSCILTRNDDSFVSLVDRSKKSNSIYADAFVSVHINAFSTPDANGFETFIHNSAPPDSVSLQNYVHDALAPFWPVDRGKKKANFYVIRPTSTNAPACLIELGFISNKDDNALLQSEEFLKQIAVKRGDSIVAFVKRKTAPD
jgi:N-acetylmuramoyl-L-alanine amidase